MATERTCATCGADISHRHRFSRYCDAHSTTQSDKGPSRAGAIAAHCKECIFDELATGTWRQQVTACTFTACNLYPFRPVSKSRSVPDETV